MAEPPSPTRVAGLARLDVFAPRAGRAYALGRNIDPGPDQPAAVSGLSPYVRHRLVTEEEIILAVLTRHSPAAAEKFIQEVFWRSYWKGWLELRPSLWRDYNARLDACRRDPALMERVARATRGESGVACFDTWMHELSQTGLLHNHTRMWFASIWCFTLGLPWVLGADLFLHHLLDADVASNLLSWRWVAGIQTPGKHYVARAENIDRCTNGRFAPYGLLNEAPLPLMEASPAAVAGLPPVPPLPAGRVGLLLHEDDLGVHNLALGGLQPVAVAGVAAPHRRSPQGASRAASAWAHQALADALAAAERRFNLPACTLREPEIAAWVDEQGLTAVITPWAPVGWTADYLACVEANLAAAGIPLIRHRRAWDEAYWPLARRGFFAFKAHIPDLIVRLIPKDGPTP